MTVTRREMLAATAAALAAPLVAPGAAGSAGTAQAAQAARMAPKFFTGPELALLEELTDILIPTDAHSPGARAAGVAAYIDFRLSESPEPDETKWRSGLAAVDLLSKELHGQAFLQGSADQRVAVLTRMAAGEQNPKTPAEHFFQEIKRSTVRAYYTSKVGIHADQQYKGNVYQRGEFAGFDAK